MLRGLPCVSLSASCETEVCSSISPFSASLTPFRERREATSSTATSPRAASKCAWREWAARAPRARPSFLGPSKRAGGCCWATPLATRCLWLRRCAWDRTPFVRRAQLLLPRQVSLDTIVGLSHFRKNALSDDAAPTESKGWQTVQLKFRAPPPGSYALQLLCVSDYWVGCDAKFAFKLKVLKAKPAELAKAVEAGRPAEGEEDDDGGDDGDLTESGSECSSDQEGN